MSDQIMLLSNHKLKMSDQTFNPRKLILYNKETTVLKVECIHFKHFLSIETT